MRILKMLFGINMISRRNSILRLISDLAMTNWLISPGFFYHHSLGRGSGGSSLQWFGVAHVPCSFTAGISKALPIPLLVLPRRTGWAHHACKIFLLQWCMLVRDVRAEEAATLLGGCRNTSTHVRSIFQLSMVDILICPTWSTSSWSVTFRCSKALAYNKLLSANTSYWAALLLDI